MLVVGTVAAAQAQPLDAQDFAPPRLAVVVAVDQLRPDYLVTFREHFGENGFARFLDGGAWFTDARHQHGVTITCPGHAVMLTGSLAETNGIVANDWWNLAEGRTEYCARDDDSPLVGITGEGRSPKNLIGSTVGDELVLATAGRARVITVSGKDRAAIMLGGHLADAAYFFEDTLAVSSRYYMEELPDWVRRFNESGAITQYFGATWDRILPESAYAHLGSDDQPGERLKPGYDRSFPHVVNGGEATPGEDFVEALEYSPFQNEVVLAFAKEIVRNEGLGDDEIPDILGIGLSANDRVGHAFGPESHEVLDVTVRTDRLLADLFAFLDEEVGLENVVVVLTADHGVQPMPETMARINPASGAMRLPSSTLRAAAEAAMEGAFGAPPLGRWVAFKGSSNIYLNPDALAAAEVPVEVAAALVEEALERVPGIREAWTGARLEELREAGSETPMVLSYHPGRSGQVAYQTDPWVVEQAEEDGTTHGTPWAYDQSVPILWYGSGIAAGVYPGEAFVTDIAPTLSHLLGVPRPSGARGRVLTEALR